MTNVTNHHTGDKPKAPVEFDVHGQPIPQNLSRHLAGADLSEEEFEQFLQDNIKARYARMRAQIADPDNATRAAFRNRRRNGRTLRQAGERKEVA